MKQNCKMQEKIEKATEQLLKMFETGDMPKAIERTFIRKSKHEAPSDSWSLGNQLLMYANDTLDARGFKQWEKAGRKIKRGSKAFYILGPCTRKVVVENEETEEKEEKIIITGFKAIPVFRYEDTEGEPIDYPDYTPEEMPPLINVAKALGIKVRYTPFTKRFWGCFKYHKNEIQLCTHDVKTFFHELSHAAHNTFRKLKPGQQPEQEIVAETSAAVLCRIYGYEGFEYHSFKYIQHYVDGMDNIAVIKGIMRVLADVQKVLEIILDTADGEERKVG